MRISDGYLHNFACFAGRHAFRLASLVYGVVAEREGAPESSNWAGKSTLLEAVPFALYGWHRYRMEDEWITHGASEGGASLTFDDGFAIVRERKHGKSTQLFCTWVGKDGIIQRASGDAAQARIVEHVGLDQKDFFATCFFEQKQMSRIATAKPGELMSIVSGWLELDRVDAGQAAARVAASTAEKGAERHAGERNAVAKQIEFVLSRVGVKTGDELKEHIAEQIVANEKCLEDARAREAGAQETINKQGAKQWVVEQKGKLAMQLQFRARDEAAIAKDPGAEAVRVEVARVDALRLEHAEADKDRAAKLKLASGEFDGKCPVAGIACPARGDINRDVARNAKLLEAAKKRRAAAQLALDEGTRTLVAMQEEQRAADAARRGKPAVDQRIAELEAAVAGSDASLDEDGLEKARSDLRSARTAAEEASRQVAFLHGVKADHEKALLDLAAVEKKLAAWEKKALAEREAAEVFRVARRQVAEESVAEVAAGANALLEAAGIDLSLSVSWERETKKGAQQQQLRLELSDRSGAAEDLAGIAFSLSASAWLRARRGAAWGVALIDEPFGALDAVNRRAFAAHFAALLRTSYGFEQAMVVAHNVDAIASFPGRVVVHAGASGSRVEVK